MRNSFSTLPRRALCPGSARMEANLPERTSDDATSGTLIHRAIHDGENSPAYRALGEEERELAKACLDLISEDYYAMWKEFWLEVPNITSGTADLVTLKDENALVVDWKTGHEPFPAMAYLQLEAQMAGVLYAFPHVETVSGGLFNPRTKQELRIELQRSELKAVTDKLEKILDAASAPNAPLNPSAEACKYCKALAT